MPSTTGSWDTLDQSTFEVELSPGVPLHFRNSPTERAAIASLAVTHGWPLVGIFVSGSGGTPSFVLHRTDFPTNPPQRADRLQDDLDDLIQGTFEVEGETDDSGNPIASRHFHTNTHVFSYRADLLYEPGSDYIFTVQDSPPSADWWQG